MLSNLKENELRKRIIDSYKNNRQLKKFLTKSDYGNLV